MVEQQSLEQLIQQEQHLNSRITQKEALVQGVRAIQPNTLVERLRHGRKLLVAEYVERTIDQELKPKLAQVSSEVNEETIQLAQGYEQEKVQAHEAYTELERTAAMMSRRTNTPTEVILQPYQEALLELEQRPLTDSLLKRGLDLLEERRKQERAEELARQQATSARDKDTSPEKRKRETYIVTFPDGKIVETSSIRVKRLLDTLIKKPLTIDEQKVVVTDKGPDITDTYAYNLLGQTNRLLNSIGKKIIQPNPPTGREKQAGVKGVYVILEQDTKIPEMVINLKSGEIQINGRRINFRGEANRAVLIHLAQHAARDIPNKTLLAVAKEAGFKGNTISSVIQQLRDLLQDNPNHPQIITSYGRTISTSYGLNAQVEFVDQKDVQPNRKNSVSQINGGREDQREKVIAFALRPTHPDRLAALEALAANLAITKIEISGLIGNGKDGKPLTNLARIRSSLISITNLLAIKNYGYIDSANENEKTIWNRIKIAINVTEDTEARKLLVSRVNEWFAAQKAIAATAASSAASKPPRGDADADVAGREQGDLLLDLERQGQVNLAERGFDVFERDGVLVLRNPTLGLVRNAAYFWILNRHQQENSLPEGLNEVQRLLEVDLPVVAGIIIKARRVDPTQRSPRLNSILAMIETSPILADLEDSVLVDILYRREAGLQVLRDRGVVIDLTTPQDHALDRRSRNNEVLRDFEGFGQRNLASKAFDIVNRSNTTLTLRCLTLDNLRDVVYAFVYNSYRGRDRSEQGLAQMQSLLEKDLSIVADLIIRGRHTDPTQRPPQLGEILGSIESSEVLKDLTDKQLVDVLYRRDAGLKVLQDRGVTVDPSQLEGQNHGRPTSPNRFVIPINETVLNLRQLDLKPWEIYAITGLLNQIGQSGLRELGLPVANDIFRDLGKAHKGTESAKGTIRQPNSLVELFAKLVMISEKGLLTPFVSRSPYISTLIDLLNGVPVETIKKILSHELIVTFPAASKTQPTQSY